MHLGYGSECNKNRPLDDTYGLSFYYTFFKDFWTYTSTRATTKHRLKAP